MGSVHVSSSAHAKKGAVLVALHTLPSPHFSVSHLLVGTVNAVHLPFSPHMNLRERPVRSAHGQHTVSAR